MVTKLLKNKIKIVLATHGSPPRDFPKQELIEFFSLNMRLEHVPQSVDDKSRNRIHELDQKIRKWPRTKENDPFYFSSIEIASQIAKKTGIETLTAFNEFCVPTIEEALIQAINKAALKIVVITPMMTPGGEHSEIDIPTTIAKVKKNNKNIDIIYAWPFELTAVADFLLAQTSKYLLSDH